MGLLDNIRQQIGSQFIEIIQWLDESVHAIGMRLRRNEDGWLGIERSFRFEYSDDGQNRRIGRVVLLGRRLVGFSGPSRAAQAATGHRNHEPRKLAVR